MIVDLSHYQGTINWEKANKVLELIIFRASVGSNKDNNYLEYTSHCTVPFGVYHFLKAGTAAEAVEEAKFFYSCATASDKKPLFYCADIEHTTQNPSNVNLISTVFADTLRSLGAQKLGLYIGQSLYSYANKDKYDFIWIPRYGKNTGEADTNYAPIYPCDIWQYTSVGHIDGINGNVDLNKLYGQKTLEWFTNTKKEEQVVSEKFTNTHFVEFLKGMVGQRYWYGTCVYKCSQDMLARKTAQYPSHYTSDRKARYNSDIAQNKLCTDCIGLAKGYAWTNGGDGVIESIGQSATKFKNSYASNGMPDKSANGMFEYAKNLGLDWGSINTIPEIPGLAVRCDGHVGYYIGNGEVVEARGFNYGVVITKLKDRPWLHWYKLPVIQYTTTSTVTVQTPESKLGDRLLQQGMKGEDVRELQHLLNTIFNYRLEEDGDFGPATLTAVKNFQSTAKLTMDGKYGAKSHEALMSMVSDHMPEVAEETAPAIVEKGITTNCTANVRAGDSTAYKIVTSLQKNTKLTPILDANGNYLVSSNKWYAVKCNNCIGWISNTVIEVK